MDFGGLGAGVGGLGEGGRSLGAGVNGAMGRLRHDAVPVTAGPDLGRHNLARMEIVGYPTVCFPFFGFKIILRQFFHLMFCSTNGKAARLRLLTRITHSVVQKSI